MRSLVLLSAMTVGHCLSSTTDDPQDVIALTTEVESVDAFPSGPLVDPPPQRPAAPSRPLVPAFAEAPLSPPPLPEPLPYAQPQPQVVAANVTEPIYVDVTVNVSGQNVPSVDTFYDQLDSYGEWYDDASYGWVFAPAVPQFVPYSNGYWTMTEFGFTWVSYDPFGWATDHYGRWVWVNRWVWLPDTTWGPAWVEWRSGNGCLGWAPRGYGSVAYFPRRAWRFVAVTQVFARDLPYHYATAVDPYLERTTPLRRYTRCQGNLWSAGPDPSWLQQQQVAAPRQRPSLNQMGRFDLPQRQRAEQRGAAVHRVYELRHERDAAVRVRLDGQARGEADTRRQQERLERQRLDAAEQMKRLGEQRNVLELDRSRAAARGAQQRLADQQRRVEAERQRAAATEERLARELAAGREAMLKERRDALARPQEQRVVADPPRQRELQREAAEVQRRQEELPQREAADALRRRQQSQELEATQKLQRQLEQQQADAAENQRRQQVVEQRREQERLAAQTQRLQMEERQREVAETVRRRQEQQQREAAEARRYQEEEQQRLAAQTQRLQMDERQREVAETVRRRQEREASEARRHQEEEQQQRLAAQTQRLQMEERQREVQTQRLQMEERQREVQTQRMQMEERQRDAQRVENVRKQQEQVQPSLQPQQLQQLRRRR